MKTFVFIAIAVAALATRARAGDWGGGGPCTFTLADAQDACDKCDFSRNYVQYVVNPCDCNEYYSCEKTRGVITAYPQRCARCLCFSKETWGCTIRDSHRPDCPEEALITEQVGYDGDYCYRFGNGPAGNYLQKYRDLPPSDPDHKKGFIWLVNDQPLKQFCPPGTYFNCSAAYCKCLICDLPHQKYCAEGSSTLFCLDNDNSGSNNGIYYNQDPSCKIVHDNVVNSDVLLFPGAPCDVEIPFFQKNQFSEFTFCGSFLLDPHAQLPTTILFDGGRPNDDCSPSFTLSINSAGYVEGTIYTDQEWTVVNTQTHIVPGKWYRVCFKYCGNNRLELLVDQSDSLTYVPTTLATAKATGSTGLNNCNLLLGSWFESNGVQGFFEGKLDHWCFSRECQP